MTNHTDFMQHAVELAQRGRGYTKTNPCVGAVVVKNSKIISSGWHTVFGGNHAEIEALHNAGESASGSDVYVTLEPCTTYGKTPPCANALIKAGIKRVFVGVVDPNPKHAGNAVNVLANAGIEVTVGVNSVACAELIEDFTKFVTTGVPYVTMKIAQSLDGKIATVTGDSKWITSEESRKCVHELRSKSDAVLIGINTALIDDPELTVRNIDTNHQPMRIVFDSDCRLPIKSKLVQGAKAGVAPLTVVVSNNADREKINQLQDSGANIIISGQSKVDIADALRQIGTMNIMNILLEGGSTLFGEFLRLRCIDRIALFVAPMLIGGDGAKSSIGEAGVVQLQDACKLASLDCRRLDIDFLFTGKLHDYTQDVLARTSAFRGA